MEVLAVILTFAAPVLVILEGVYLLYMRKVMRRMGRDLSRTRKLVKTANFSALASSGAVKPSDVSELVDEDDYI